jgi:hypothetical protein
MPFKLLQAICHCHVNSYVSALCSCQGSIIYIQGVHKRMVQFQKLTRNLFLNLHGHNVHRQQRKLSKFLVRYEQFTSHAYCGSAGPVSKMASQQEKTFRVLRFEVSRSVITVQREFCARFRTAILIWELLVAHALPTVLNCAQNPSVFFQKIFEFARSVFCRDIYLSIWQLVIKLYKSIFRNSSRPLYRL